MALIAAGESPNSSFIENGLNYMKSQQAENGGFLFWGATNANSDSWAVLAITSAGGDPMDNKWIENGKTPIDHLLTLQQDNGSFMNVPQTTAYSIQALLGKPYPVKPAFEVTKPGAEKLPIPVILSIILVVVVAVIGSVWYLRRR